MMNHTPDPWTVAVNMRGLNNMQVCGVLAATGEAVANCGAWKDAEANARLIAAAPELLAALTWALAQIEDDLDPDHQAALTAAHAAIAKATNKEQTK